MQVGQLALYAFAASGAVAWMLVASLLIAWLQIKPWSAENRDHSAKVAVLPHPLYAFGCWYRQLGMWLVRQVPSPMHAVDIASASQVRLACARTRAPPQRARSPVCQRRCNLAAVQMRAPCQLLATSFAAPGRAASMPTAPTASRARRSFSPWSPHVPKVASPLAA